MLYVPPAVAHASPLLSVVIIVRDRAEELRACIASLEAQIDPPDFEVVIVDDGSTVPAYAAWTKPCQAAIRIVRQPARGISAARNRGVEMSRGRWIMFTDSDCEVCPHTLCEVGRALMGDHGNVAFQLQLVGDRSNMVERMEEIRLVATQQATSKPDGRIHYLATGGFVIHGDYARYSYPLFDPKHLRSEDSALLAQLMAEGNLPILIKGAVVRHKPRQTIIQYARKHFWIGYRSIAARRALEQTGHKFITGRSRYGMLRVMYLHARAEHITLTAVGGLLFCHMLNRAGRVVGRLKAKTEQSAPADPAVALEPPVPHASPKSGVR